MDDLDAYIATFSDEERQELAEAGRELDLDAIRYRLSKASPGPWHWSDWQQDLTTDEPEDLARNAVLEFEDETDCFCDVLPFDGRSPWFDDGTADTYVRYRPNAEFIAHSREDVDLLLAEVDRLRHLLASKE